MVKKKIVVVGEVFSENLGDYAIFDSLKNQLEKRNIEAIPLDLSFRKGWVSTDSNISKTIDEKNNKIISKLKNFLGGFLYEIKWKYIQKNKISTHWDSLIKGCDGLIIGGGQIITDSPACFLPKIDFIVGIANKYNKPYSIVGCGVGNNIRNKYETQCRKIMQNSSYISLRDKKSKDRLESYLGGGCEINTFPDLAFALEHSGFVEQNEIKVCGFNIMPLETFKKLGSIFSQLNEQDYLLFWEEILKNAIKSGMKVLLMTNGNRDDYKQAEIIYEHLVKQGIDVILLDRPIKPNDLYNQISKVDYLVSTRMHAGIIGCAFEKSVCTIEWDDKIPNVWDMVGGRGAVINCNVLKENNPWAVFEKSFYNTDKLNDFINIKNQIEIGIDECINIMFKY